MVKCLAQRHKLVIELQFRNLDPPPGIERRTYNLVILRSIVRANIFKTARNFSFKISRNLLTHVLSNFCKNQHRLPG